MKHRKFIAVLMMALCLIGTMPFSISAYRTLFVLGDTYQYNDVTLIETPLFTVPDESSVIPVNVLGTISPIDINIIDSNGVIVGNIDLTDALFNVILGVRSHLFDSVEEVTYETFTHIIQIIGVADYIVYAPSLGINIPRFQEGQSFTLTIGHEILNQIVSDTTTNITNEYISFISLTIDGVEQEFDIQIPEFKITIDTLIDDTPEIKVIITGIMSAFIPVNPIQTQITYTTQGFFNMASNAFSFIQNYVVIDNPIILVSLIIMALALCLVILKFIFIRR